MTEKKEFEWVMKIQYYGQGCCRVFEGNEVIADITSEKMVDAESAIKLLKLLGYKFSKVTKFDWGFEVRI